MKSHVSALRLSALNCCVTVINCSSAQVALTFIFEKLVV